MRTEVKNNMRLVVDPESLDEYEASEPYHRFMKILIDSDIFPDAPLCMTLVTYPPEAKCELHFHPTAVEVYLVLQGELTAIVERDDHIIHEGQLIYIPPGTNHYAENRRSIPCRFVAIHVPRVDDVNQVKKEWMVVRPQDL
jgi:mannose-6-phosphate isomerase-like protein (cupin superfamily)